MHITKNQVDYCMECGVCTGSCPISQETDAFSPRQIIKRLMVDSDEGLLQSADLWKCLSCARCSNRCPVKIDYPDLVKNYREKARQQGSFPWESHHGVFQDIKDLQIKNESDHRTQWTEGVGAYQSSGDYYYFTGCTPFFEVVFRYLAVDSLHIARSSLKLLNRIGITPALSNKECCCGHDALWSGDKKLFKKLADRNIETIKETKAKVVITSCPECYLTLNRYYTDLFGSLPFKVKHLTEILLEDQSIQNLQFNQWDNRLTYHDPCRLGRWSDIYEAPRTLLQKVPKAVLTEMERNRQNALCCGTTAWIECSQCSKAMQVERLLEAEKTGATMMITACPKCEIHFNCARRNTDIKIEVKDIFTFLSQQLTGDQIDG